MAKDRGFRLLAPSSAEPAPYEVGYAKPPAASRFKPGRSGNPKGRPKGAKNKRPALHEERLKTIILDEAYRDIKINEGARQVTISMAKAVIRSIAVNAARGQLRSQQLFTELLSSTEQANKALYNEYLQTMIEYKTDWERNREYRKAHRVIAPDPIPHPDDIVIDMKTGEALVFGPMTKEERVVWDRLRKRLDDRSEEIQELRKLAADPESASYRQSIEDDLAFEIKLRNKLQSIVGNWPHVRGQPPRRS